MTVAAHALDDASALLAAKAGVDLLAHTPTEPLSATTVAAWKTGAVILDARRVRVAGRDRQPSQAARGRRDHPLWHRPRQPARCRTVGERDAAPESGRSRRRGDRRRDDDDPRELLNIDAVTNGADASYLILEREFPRLDAKTLLSPRAVWLRGRRVR